MKVSRVRKIGHRSRGLHSLWMFLLQLLLAFQDVVFLADNPEMIATDLFTWDVRFQGGWAHWCHSTEWLAGVDGTRFWIEGEFGEPGAYGFKPGCAVTKGHYGHDHQELPTCDAWYLLLIGELRLREEPDFSVRMLELCLVTLSGSVFLLIIR
ncbi:hypothetical protein AAVH_27472 [Aphelenchoides avenae]|nr:hypothetical protein AAVH_27472 [Aphelenchus avenae]